jgi:choline transport protein
MTGGCTIFLAGWYLYIRNKGYVGPRALVEEVERRLARGEDVVVGAGGGMSGSVDSEKL